MQFIWLAHNNIGQKPWWILILIFAPILLINFWFLQIGKKQDYFQYHKSVALFVNGF